jgi:hypothetical protein
MSSEKDNKAITIDFASLFETEYQKAVPGTYDESFFTDPQTGKFRFPAYNPLFKGMISIKDESKYKQMYFTRLSAKETLAFTMDDFERNFDIPWFTTEKFSDFMDRLPESAFDKGISKENVLYLFKKLQRFINDEEIEKYYIFEKDKSTDALRIGLLLPFDTGSIKPRELWGEVHTFTLRDICKANDIPTTSKRETMLERILQRNPDFPFNVVVPAPLLKETWLSFVDFYLNDIRENIDRLHPLYFEPVWEMVMDTNYGKSFKNRVQKLINSRYWAGRLTTKTIDDDGE